MPGLTAWWRIQPLANHYPPLHGLRVLAILSVFQVHVTILFVNAGLILPTFWPRFSASIWFGMDLFFILSGFLIGRLLLVQPRREGKPSKRPILRFYARRSFRIFPQYYVVLTTLIVTTYLLGQPVHGDVIYEYAYLTNYIDWTHLPAMTWAWSLCVEEHFYLAVPLLMLALGRTRSPKMGLWVLGIAWFVAIGIRVLEYGLGPPIFDGPWTEDLMLRRLYNRTHTRLDILVAGVTLAWVEHHFRDALALWLQRSRNRIGLALLIPLCLAFLLAPNFHDFGFWWELCAWGGVSSIMLSSIIVLLLYQPGTGSRRVASALSSKRFLTLATFGYGMYLVHVPVAYFGLLPLAARMHAAGWPALVIWLFTLFGLVVGAAAVSYGLHLLVDKPFLKLRARVAS